MSGLLRGLRSFDLLYGNVIEDKCNTILGALVHHRMCFLIIEFVSLADFELVWLTVNHESNSWIRRYRNMDSMSAMKGRVAVDMW